MRRLLDAIYRTSGALAAIAVAAITALVCGQVILNLINWGAKVVLGQGWGLLIPSYASLAGYALAFATFLSLGLGLRRAAHIRVTLLESHLPPPLRRGALLAVTFAGVLVGALFAVSLGQLAWQSLQWGDQSVGLLKIPLWIPQSVVCLGMIVFLIAALDTFWEVARRGDSAALHDNSEASEGL